AVRQEPLDGRAGGDVLRGGPWTRREVGQPAARRQVWVTCVQTAERVIFWAVIAGIGLGMLLVAESLL
ncbi:MAG: hypothetical protein AB3N23_00050, partial [Paracoccaceae bacterium]